MAEEHRCQAQEGHRLCANNCGFFGSPATMDLCSKCYRDFRLKEQQQASIKSTVETSLASASSALISSSSSSASPTVVIEPFSPPPPPQPATILPEIAVQVRATAPAPATQSNRCSVCMKRVGLTGFKCRCDVTFCGVHRYPEKHGCTFDFKKVGREEIARANPLVKAVKLEKI